MNIDFLIQNLTNPALLFFALGLFAVWVKSETMAIANQRVIMVGMIVLHT